MKEIEKAIEILKNEGIISIPTETVYGLAGSIESPKAINQIFQLKERPFFDPLIVHVASIDQAKSITGKWDQASEILAEKFWPGSLTLILPKGGHISPIITSGLDTVGVRIPNHPLTLQLLKELKTPLAAPSANKFKKTSPTNSSHVTQSFPDLFVLDGGECQIGIESTIVQVSENQTSILRPGMISKSDIEKALNEAGIKTLVNYKESEIAPGHLKHHYMPERPLILQYTQELNSKSIPRELLKNPAVYQVPKDPIRVARELYQKLREFDTDASAIIFKLDESVLAEEHWQGIINRLEKAASFILSK